MTKPMSEDERVVREAWVFVQLYHREEGYRVKCGPLGGFDGAWVSNADEAWSLAAEYTRQRQRETAEVQEEIALQKKWIEIHVGWIVNSVQSPECKHDQEVAERTLAARIAALAEKQKGMVKK